MENKLKKTYSLILAILLLLQLIPPISYGIEGYTSHPVYNGVENPQDQLKNFHYSDISGHWGTVPILEMAGLSLMRGVAPSRFRPNSSLTYVEALTVLVRAIGKEAEAQQLGELQAPANVRSLLLLSAVHNWGKGAVQVAVNEGIITNEEINQIINLTPQEQENLENQLERQLARFQNGGYSGEEIAEIERQVKEKLENAVWNRPVPRQQVAVWVARALKLQGIYGDKIVKTYGFDDWEQIDTEKIPLIEAVLNQNIMTGITPNTFAPRDEFTRVQMAQVMFNVGEAFLVQRGITQKIGRVMEIEEIIQQQQANEIKKRVYTILNQDNSQNYLTSDAGRDFLVQKEGGLSLSSLLEQGDVIYYFINPQQEIIYARVVPTKITKIEGFIDLVDVDNNRFAMTDFDGKKHLMELPAFTEVMVNGVPASLEDLIYGQEVKATLRQGMVVSIEAYLEEDPYLHGYIPPGSKTKVGDVLLISSTEIELQVEGEREKYRILPTTIVTRNDQHAKLFEVKEGDRVILSFDDIYSADIASIKVEDDERHITNIYRGKLEYVSERNKEMIINSISEYQGATWNPHPQQKISIKVEGDIYLGGNQITLKELSGQTGKELYVAVENSYGTQRAAKVLVKEGSTILYENKVTGLQFGNSRMVVENNTISFNEGTIVVQNNRLVDILNLENQQSIYLAADLNQGRRNATFISIEYDGMMDDRIDGTRLVVYRGRIEDLGDYSLTLGRLAYQLDYLKLENHQWGEIARPQKLTMTEDTYVFDSEIQKEVPTGYFLNSRFIDPNQIQDLDLRTRIKNNHYIGKSAFIIARETTLQGETTAEILGINLTPNHFNYYHILNTDHSAIGEIAEVDLDANEMTITNLRHWNTLSSRWESVRTQEVVSMEKATILVNDKPISREEFYQLKQRAKVYIIKSKASATHDDAYIVVVEQ
ncbi:S-layer homology domain-containing protein [Alkaliphilus hydrothermalis]|uniref:SLH domain-containing protein n=1 Tax=Alkaliphilus hydrothermalis TaxID=1482730 RepID=A0ABS2NQB4_9FIRM|nr:S-layer homology domain-containing protein [Alkaliphilus hydrothermalis]MBM7614799.1 hypothetical protein [Alkaliphilus hydrothermalis]